MSAWRLYQRNCLISIIDMKRGRYMNISISESGSVSMSMNIDFRLYAKFRNEQICTDTLSKITVIYDEDEECSF